MKTISLRVGFLCFVLAGLLGPVSAQDIKFPTKGSLIRTDRPDTMKLIRFYNKMVARNLDHETSLPSAVIDSVMAELEGMSVRERIGGWADFLYRRSGAKYVFGLDEDGYVSRGLLVDDKNTDCVLFFYRTSELGRSNSAVEAVQFAYGTRFYGAPIVEAVGADGTVDYDNEAHLDYTIDMIRSGIWGTDVSDSVGVTVADRTGTSRYPPDSVRYIPSDKIDYGAIKTGDGIHCVLDENEESGRKIRDSGAMIGHIGVAVREGGTVYIIHPASSGLPGVYEGGRIVKVPLKTYLDRVDKFKGIIVTRVQLF
jgi:hypothetical protein